MFAKITIAGIIAAIIYGLLEGFGAWIFGIILVSILAAAGIGA